MKAYLPNVKWYYISSGDVKVDKTGHITIPDNKEGIPPVHLRGGHIIPVSGEQEFPNTESVRGKGVRLAVLPANDKTASGDLFWDDGESIDTIERNQYNYYTFDLHKDCSLDIKVEKSGYKTNHTLTEIVIYGTNGDSIEASLDGKHLDKASYYMKGPMLVFKHNIDLNSKTIGQKWTLKWKSIKTNLCNVL